MSLLEELIPLADAHRAADEYVSGTYEWVGGACAVGCTVHDAIRLGKLPADTGAGDHRAVARATGLPEMVWRLANRVFEGLPAADQPAWTPRFLRAAAASPSPATVPARVMARLARRLADDAIREDVRAASLAVAALWGRRGRGDDPPEIEWDAARSRAAAARSRAAAALSRADAALSRAAEEAVQSQAGAAWSRAEAALSQAGAALSRAEASYSQAGAAWSQAEAAWSQAEAALSRAGAARSRAGAAWSQADAVRSQADAVQSQADAALSQAGASYSQAAAARENFWRRCADLLCEELTCAAV